MTVRHLLSILIIVIFVLGASASRASNLSSTIAQSGDFEPRTRWLPQRNPENLQCYKEDVLARISANWRREAIANALILLTLGRSGGIVTVEAVSTGQQSESMKKAIYRLVWRIKSTRFAVLPEYYKPDVLTVSIDPSELNELKAAKARKRS